MIYLDNSATTYPKPQGVRQAVQRSFIEQGANPGRSGYGMCLSTTRAVYRVRQLAAEFFGAPGPECVLFQPSCTQALNLVIKGFLKPGDHVVITDLEHNAVARPLEAIKARGVSYSVVPVTPGTTTPPWMLSGKLWAPKQNWPCAPWLPMCSVSGCRWSASLPCAISTG